MKHLLSLVLGLCALPAGFAAEAPPDLLKTDLMVVVAHPDDEGMAAAMMTRYALGEGKTVACVHATRGEGGGNEVGTQLGPALGQLREAELRQALGRMGVRHLFFLDEEDWAYTESAAATLAKWEHNDALGKLVRIVRNLRPEVIVTFMPAPTGGQHGHHQTAGILATEAFTAAAEPTAFPDQLKREGLRPWQPKRLFFVGQYPEGKTVSVATDGKAPDGRTFAEIAAEAMTQHKSQGFGSFGGFRGPARPSNFTLVKTALPPDSLDPDDLLAGVESGSPLLAMLQPVDYRYAPGQTGDVRIMLQNTGSQPLVAMGVSVPKQEGWTVAGGLDSIRLPRSLAPGERTYRIVNIRVSETLKPGQDLPVRMAFSGSTEDQKEAVSRPTETVVSIVPPLEARIVPLPGIQRYRDWTRSQQIERFAGVLPSWVPFAAGQPGDVRVEVIDRAVRTGPLNVRLAMPDGWMSAPPSHMIGEDQQANRSVEFRVTPPANAKVADVPFRAVARGAGKGTLEAAAEAAAQVTPYAEVPRVTHAPTVDGDLGDWKGTAEILVPSSNRVQGEFRDDADGSAVARLAYDDHYLYVGVRVQDESVVSNIAPNDIKAHWRTDSVEITLDPRPRSESTLTTFKAGIFPWDTAGKPRAARDADTNPGPVEETAPGMKLASKRTADGYLIETAIPWDAVGTKPKAGMRLGFNLLLYDGDQKDARVGDGIGEGRLAWSPRPGVWGRPEQWGEIRLR